MSDSAPLTTIAPTVPVIAFGMGGWRISIAREVLSPDHLRARYDRFAAGWQARIDRLQFEQAYAELLTRTDIAHVFADHTRPIAVLDAGIGTGAMSTALCRTWPGQVALSGVDISADMLSEARKRLNPLVHSLTLTQGDIERLPLPDESLDIVMMAHVLEHIPDPSRALAELFRVLRPGGVLITSITRRSWAGAYIQLLWRTHSVSIGKAKSWLNAAGFTRTKALPFSKAYPARKFSIAYVAHKPL